jgi:hypothetical protein
VPQQGNYDLYDWDGSKYAFTRQVRAGGTNNQPNLGMNATHLDEFTLSAQQQLGPTVGVGVRGIYRKWHDLIDDIQNFDSNGNFIQTYTNDPQARRTYKGIEFTFEKRFSHNWNFLGNYTYSQVRGNHFAADGIATGLLNFIGLNCTTAVDPTVGTIPCANVNSPSQLSGHPTWDIPNHVNLLGSYAFNFGPVALTAGSAGVWSSGPSFSKTRTLTVLNQAGKPSGKTTTYFYDGQGTDRAPNWYQLDTSLEATYRIFGVEVGAKGEVFNITNNQVQVVVNNVNWCNTTSTTACNTAVTRYGKSSARNAFLTPRNFRLTALIRF